MPDSCAFNGGNHSASSIPTDVLVAESTSLQRSISPSSEIVLDFSIVFFFRDSRTGVYFAESDLRNFRATKNSPNIIKGARLAIEKSKRDDFLADFFSRATLTFSHRQHIREAFSDKSAFQGNSNNFPRIFPISPVRSNNSNFPSPQVIGFCDNNQTKM